MFQLTKKEVEILCSQNASANISPKSRSLPYVFTEHGVSQVAYVLNSKMAIEMSIKIINAFIANLLQTTHISQPELSSFQTILSLSLKSDSLYHIQLLLN